MRLSLLALVLLALPAWAGKTPAGQACAVDSECAEGNICDKGFCAPISHDRRIIPPFYFSKKGQAGYRDIVPLGYFHHWGQQTDNLVAFPWFWRFRDKSADDTTSVVPLPLPMFWTKTGPKSTFVVPFLLAGSSYNASTGEHWRVWFPFMFDHETKDERTTIAPLVWYHRSPGKTSTVVFPLVWHSKDTVTGYQHTLAIPFVDYEVDERGRHKRIASFLGFWERDDSAGLKQGLLLTPPIFVRKDPFRTVAVVPPLFTYWKVHDDKSSGFVAGPVFHSSDPEGTTSGVFPILWLWRDTKQQRTTAWLFPVAGFHKSPDVKGAYLGPIYGWSGNKGWGAGLAPLFFFGRSGPKHHAVVFPLVWRFSDDEKQSSTTMVGPVYAHKEKDGWDAGVLPVFFAGRHQDRTYGVLAPIYWHFGQKDGSTDVAGPLYVQRFNDGWRFGLAPIFFFGNKAGRSHQVIFPLVFHFADKNQDTDTLLAGPFYHQRRGTHSLDILFPLMYLARSPGRGLLITPVAGWSKDPDKETLVVGPYIQQKDHKNHSTTRFLFPLGAVHEAPNYKVTVQFPFFWRVKEGDETDTVVFPIYWRVRSPRMTFDGVFPLFARAKTPDATTTIAGPIWSRTKADGRSFGLFPLFAYGSNVKEGKPAHWFGMPGIFYRYNARFDSGELIVGPFYDIKRANGYDAGLPPLLFAWRRGTSSYVITPIFYRQHDSAADSSMNVLGPLYFGHNGPTKKFGLFPLFFAKTGPEGGSGGVFPLFYVKTKPKGSIFATLLFGYSKYESGWRFYFGPVYARRDAEYSSTALWPLVYFMKNHTSGASFRMALPLYLDGRSDDGRELQMMTPAIWRYHSVERSIIVGLPLFFDVHSYGESRTTGIFPLFIRNRSWASNSVSYTFPPLLLFARHRWGGNDPGTDVVWFPLIWRYGGRDSTTVVAPIYWDFKRGNDRTTVGFPVFAYWKRVDAKRLVLLNMYYRRGINHEEGSWHCYVIPFVDFGRPRKQDLEWNVLLGLFGYSRQGINRTLKLFWLWEVKLEPVRSQNLSWFGSTDPSARTEF